VRRGAYVLLDPAGSAPIDAILIATGSEVYVALDAAGQLNRRGIRVRVVSMPSWELFAAQSPAYRDEVLPPSVRARVALEAAGPMGWTRWTTDDGVMLGLERFGASAPGERLYQEFKLAPEHIMKTVEQLLQNKEKR
jgi:transketolase